MVTLIITTITIVAVVTIFSTITTRLLLICQRNPSIMTNKRKREPNFIIKSHLLFKSGKSLEHFTKLEFAILIPEKNSLYGQTVRRLQDFLVDGEKTDADFFAGISGTNSTGFLHYLTPKQLDDIIKGIKDKNDDESKKENTFSKNEEKTKREIAPSVTAAHKAKAIINHMKKCKM